MDHNHTTVKTFMAIIAERDAAVRERNMALEERKRAFAERDLAMLHRDAAISERDAAIQERDDAMATLRNLSSMNDSISIPDSLGNELASETKNIQYSQQMRTTEASYAPRGGNDLNITEGAYGHRGGNDLNISEAAYGQRGGNDLNITEAAYSQRGGNDLNIREAAYSQRGGNDLNIREAGYSQRGGNDLNVREASQPVKPRRGRQPKEGKSTKSAKSPRNGKRAAEGLSKPVNSNGWINERNSESDEDDPEKQVSWKDNLGLNQINFDESAMPVPVCTCTGSPQPCYRWGNGGWQSACCTTTISMYPLPQMANKRYSRIGGRKMSGSAFGKLLNRLAAEGQDFSNPLDLKDHWAKHGTNRYSTLK